MLQEQLNKLRFAKEYVEMLSEAAKSEAAKKDIKEIKKRTKGLK